MQNNLGKICVIKIKTNILETAQNPRKKNFLQSLSFKVTSYVKIKSRIKK